MKRLVPFILLIVVVVGGLVAVGVLLQVDGKRPQLQQALSQRLRRPVLIAKLDAGLFPPTLRLHDVSVLEKDSSSETLLHADEADAELAWAGVFRLRAIPTRITLQHGTLSVRRLANGSWGLDDWMKPFSEIGSGQNWPLSEVLLRQWDCHWIDDYAPLRQELVLQGVDGSVQLGPEASASLTGSLAGAAPVAFSFEGKGRFFHSPRWSGDFKLSDEGRQWTVHVDAQGAQWQAKGDSSQWRLDQAFGLLAFYARLRAGPAAGSSPAMLQDWRTHFSWQTSSGTFYHSATVGGGPTELKGSVSAGAQALTARFSGGAKDLPLQAVEPLVAGTALLEGRLTGLVTNFEFEISSHPWTSAGGQGTWDVQEGRYHFSERTLQSLAKAHLMAYMRKKFPGFEDQGLPFAKAALRWRMAGGIVSIDEGWVDLGAVKAAVAGKLDGARHGVDAYVRLQVRDTSAALLKDIPGKYILGSPGRERVQPIFGRLQGTWGEWSLRATSSGRIPSLYQSNLRKSIQSR